MYFDGSHYIAIPHTERPKRYRPKPEEEKITVAEQQGQGSETDKAAGPLFACESDVTDGQISEPQADSMPQEATRTMTRKELFEELYDKYIDLPKRERHYKVMEGMEAYFDTVEQLKQYVDLGFERKARNLRARRVRMTRKAYLANFNYFCTFTYDGKKHTEQSFRAELPKTLQRLSKRNGWKYMGVWERSPENKRLHFHGLFAIPYGKMIGFLFDKTDYSFKAHKMQTTIQNSYFNEKYGRSDFEEVVGIETLGEALGYIMKYIGKSGERIVYSKGLYQYFISDIMDDDVICRIGQEDKKLLLFDDFDCWDEGIYMGRVSREVIAQMRKSIYSYCGSIKRTWRTKRNAKKFGSN